MQWSITFLANSILLGAGLAMDAFSVSLANGLNEPKMKLVRMSGIAGVFAGFQAFMPLTGWLLVHTVAQLFESFQALIPWIALILLLYLGGKMLIGGIKNKKSEAQKPAVGFRGLILQGIATSIDALSVGFTIADYDLLMAVVCALIIAAVTFVLCMAGLMLGKRFGTKLAGKAEILGGIILIAIGVEIFIGAF